MSDVKRKYMVATDVGGTCTDTIVFAAGEPAHLGKTLSTPPDFSGAGSNVEPRVALRRFACPQCGHLLDTETALPEDPFLEDIVAA